MQLVVPKPLRDQVLHCFHGTAWAGHQGVRRTLAAMRRHVWWPSWEADTAYWVQHCWPCQARKRSGKMNHWPLVLRDMPTAAFDSLGIDIFGPLPISAAGHTHVLVIQDIFTRYVNLYALLPSQNTAEGLAAILVDQYCTQHGVPRKLLSDRGSQFMAELSEQVYRHMGVRKLFTTAYHPQCNGMVERFMQSLAQMLAMVVDGSHSDWHIWLSHVAFAYNASEHAATGVTPFLLATGREPRLALHVLAGGIADATTTASEHISGIVADMLLRQREAHSVADKRFKLKQASILKRNAVLADALGVRSHFKAGEKVWLYRAPVTHTVNTADGDSAQLSRKFLNYWQGPYEVLCVGPGSIGTGDKVALVGANCLLIMRDGSPQRVSVHQCKKCRDPTSSNDRPEGLPTGFARYLLAVPRHALPPTGLDDNVATWESDRHGVEAILDHRVLTQARGRAPVLQYRVRWEGDGMTDTWEPAANLDSCPEALSEYWHQLSVSHDTSGTPIKGSDTAVVRGRMRQAELLRSGETRRCAHTGERFYAVPPGNAVLQQHPGLERMQSKRCQRLRVLIVWPYDEGKPTEHCKWCDGMVLNYMAAPAKRGQSLYRVSFLDGGKPMAVPLLAERYSTDVSAEKWSWCIYGTEAELTKLAQRS